jgi:hypothetical protein
VWEAFQEIACISGNKEDYLKKIGMWKAVNAKNKGLKANDLFVQTLYASTLWAIYRGFCKKFVEDETITTQDLTNKAMYGGITQLAGILNKQIQEAKTEEQAGSWKMKAFLIRRLIQNRRTSTSNSLSRLFASLTKL